MKLCGAVLVAPAHNPGGQRGWSFHLQEDAQQYFMPHAIPFPIRLKLESGSDADAGRADYAALFHHGLHFI
jgi:hypothetical protein